MLIQLTSRIYPETFDGVIAGGKSLGRALIVFGDGSQLFFCGG